MLPDKLVVPASDATDKSIPIVYDTVWNHLMNDKTNGHYMIYVDETGDSAQPFALFNGGANAMRFDNPDEPTRKGRINDLPLDMDAASADRPETPNLGISWVWQNMRLHIDAPDCALLLLLFHAGSVRSKSESVAFNTKCYRQIK